MIEYSVEEIYAREAKAFIRENHYSHSCHNGPNPCFGLFHGIDLLGVLIFATPCSENVRASIFGAGTENSVTELHRLWIEDTTPKNTESWFIARCLKALKKLKPYIRVVVSFSDLSEGHEGTIYQASNFVLVGKTGKRTFYRDEDGRLRHPRQCGVNITSDEAMFRAWIPEVREAKTKWAYPLGDNKIDTKKIRSHLQNLGAGL